MYARRALLIILDGWGLRRQHSGNAIAAAKTPYYDSLLVHYPHTRLAASGSAVGLPDGQIGTSEVNHLTIGAGRVLEQSLVRINQDIASGSLWHNQTLGTALAQVKKHRSTLHLIGLYSYGGVHSHADHLRALVSIAKDAGVDSINLHLFSDGRDVLTTMGKNDFVSLQHWLRRVGVARITSVSGRYFAMDRDENWGRTNRAYAAIAQGAGNRVADIKTVFTQSYQQGVTDEYILPTTLPGHKPFGEHDAVVCFNFRADRMRQLTHLLLKRCAAKHVVTMVPYHNEFAAPALFDRQTVRHHLVEVCEQQSIVHHHISETEKYAHVTYYFNGRREQPYPHERRIHIKSSDDIATHDLRPQMRAAEITQAVQSVLTRSSQKPQQGRPEFVVVNYANADIVGHTGNFAATVSAIEVLDIELKRVVERALEHDWVVLITADHGNAEMLIDPATGEPHTAHTLNPVPLIAIDRAQKLQLTTRTALLCDIAPTVLHLMELPKPQEMTGTSLVGR